MEKRRTIPMDEIRNRLNRLYKCIISAYGENHELHTFELCANDGIELLGSTIDKITEDEDGNVRFYFNENTGDYEVSCHIPVNALDDFATSLVFRLLKRAKALIASKKEKTDSNEDRINNIQYDDIVNLLSTALYGNNILEVQYTGEKCYDEVGKPDESICFEDKLARILFAGGNITIVDNEAEGAAYGQNDSTWFEDDIAFYPINLVDIKKGLLDAYHSEDKALRESVISLLDEDGMDFDFCKADCLLQQIVFGEVIYG